MATTQSVTRAPRPSSLADVLDLILDKGLVIDAYVRVSLVGIELLTIDARIVVASVDTYLHYAEAVNRLDLTATETSGLPEFFGNASGNGNGSGGRSDDRDDSTDGRGERGGQRAEIDSGRGRDRHGERGRGQDEQEEQDEQGDREKSPSLASRLADRGRWSK